MHRAGVVAFLFCCAGCGSAVPLPGLRGRLESGGRSAEGPLDALRLNLEEGYALQIASCAGESQQRRVRCRILQDGGILDEPEFVVELGRPAEFSVRLGPPPTVSPGIRTGCPPASVFARFEWPVETRVRLFIAAPK